MDPSLHLDASPRWHLALHFSPEQAKPFFQSTVWGARYGCGTERPEWVEGRGRILPEGVLMILHCRRCARRHEVLADFRGLGELYFAGAAPPVDFARFGLEYAQGVEKLLLARHLRAWLEAHERCLRVSSPEPPPALQPTIRSLFQEAALHLRERGEVSSALHLFTASEELWSFDGSTWEAPEASLLGLRVREALRQRRAEARSLFQAEEISGSGAGEGVWRLAVRLGEESWLGEAEIDRFDRPRPSPGRLGPLSWRPSWEAAEDLDGLLVSRLHFPLPRSGKAVAWSAAQP